MTAGRKRGFALVTSMAAVTLVMMLLGAFFAANRSYVQMSRLDQDKTACRDAVLALSDYCRFRLEGDRTWGTGTAVAPYNLKDKFDREVFSFTEIEKKDLADYPSLVPLPGDFHVIGKMAANDVSFQLAFTNNLKKSTASEDGVQKECCRLVIEAQRGSSREVVQVGYRAAAFFDATLAASKDIKIKVGGGEYGMLALSSVDPVHNELRSLNNVHLPRKEDIVFRPDDKNLAATKGTVWARHDISLADDKTQDALDAAAAATQGQFIANGRSQYDAPELVLEEARKLGDSLPLEEFRNGSYFFKKSRINYTVGGVPTSKIVPTFLRFDSLYNNATGQLTDFDFVASDIPGADPSSVSLDGHPAANARSHATDNFKVDQGPIVSFYEGAEFKPTARLPANKKLVVKDGVSADGKAIAGDFKLKGADDIVPTVSFEGKSENKKVFLDVQRSIILEGIIKGDGRLIAGETVALQANTLDVEADSEDDLAIYAGENVKIYPGSNAGTAAAGPLTDDDDPEEPSQAPPPTLKTRTLVFRGLVYAGNDFTFDHRYRKIIDDAPDEWFGYDVNLRIRGAVVARGGQIRINGTRKVNLIYDPAYLDNFLDKSVYQDRQQVEQLSWRPL